MLQLPQYRIWRSKGKATTLQMFCSPALLKLFMLPLYNRSSL